MLFEEFKYFDHQFPEPQYLGAKHTHLAWMNKFIPRNVVTAVDAFAGSQAVAFLLKQLGFQVISNDFLNFNHQIGLALIENEEQKLTQADLNFLLSTSPAKARFRLIEQVYTNIFFEKEEAEFLDNFRANLELLENPYKKALAFAIINRSMTRKVTMGHFGHTQALRYANDPERIKRNRSLVRPLKEIFLELVPAYNSAIFSNKKNNRSHNQNILDLLPTLKEVDLIYFDPPYCDSHADYQSFYHLLETYTEYWQDKQFINGTRRYDPQRFSGFDKKKVVVQSFEKIFEYAQEIPYWLISYNDRSYPSVEELATIISKFKNVEIEAKTYQNGRGGKGSVAGSREILFVCKPKPKHFVNLTSRADAILNEEL